MVIGTPGDNSRDMVRKERSRTAKLTWALVGEIRERYAAGEVTQLQLAGEYGVTVVSISNLLRGRTWAPQAA